MSTRSRTKRPSSRKKRGSFQTKAVYPNLNVRRESYEVLVDIKKTHAGMTHTKALSAILGHFQSLPEEVREAVLREAK